jgi:fructose-1,6-bisphosphatase/inositol monophosphatase family enzyme
MKRSFEEELGFAKKLAVEMGDIIMKNYSSSCKTEVKCDGSVVTLIDKEVSAYAESKLIERFPEYGIINEERPERNKASEIKWVIDPLDGTIEFATGGKDFGVFIGLMKNYKPVMGVAYRPLINEITYASKGNGAYLRNENGVMRLAVSASNLISLLISKRRNSCELDEMIKNLNPDSVRKMGGSFKTIEVAKGNANLFLSAKDITMNSWDLCAAEVILSEAGGILTNLEGKRINYKETENKNGIIAASKMIYRGVLRALH